MKKTLILVSTLALAGLADAATLKWMVDGAHWASGEAESGSISFSSASVGARKSDSYLVTTDASGIELFAASVGLTKSDTDIHTVLLENASGKTFGVDDQFFVDLWDNEGNLIARSAYFGYGDILTGFDAINSGIGASGAGTWAVSAFGSVPEPTSAVLLVLGFAALALKRKANN